MIIEVLNASKNYGGKPYVSFSEIESPSLLFRRGRYSPGRKRKSNLIRIQQAR